MPHFEQLKQQVNLLYALVRLQKGARLGLRALWIGLAGILLGWTIHALTGWLPNPLSWFGLGLAAALVPIIGVVAALYPVLTDTQPPRRWIYALDRRLRLRQQLSTAWEVVQKGQRGPVADLLVADLAAQMPNARQKILAGGWYRKVDLAASAIMGLLVCVLLASLLFKPTVPPTPAQAAPQQAPQQSLAPQDQQQPDAAGQQPGQGQNGQNGDQAGSSQGQGDNSGQNNAGSNQPGNTDGRNGSDQQQSGTDQAGSSTDPSAGQDPGAVADALKQLGQELSKQAGTYDLGQALENLQMNSAADQLQNLKDQLKEKEMSQESRDNLSKALDNAAQNLNQANQPSLSQDMQNAANALKDQNGSPEQPLNQLSQDLRQLDNAMQASQSAGSGAGQGQNGNSGQAQAPAERLPDENGQMELPLDNPQNSGLLSPASPDANGSGTAQGSLDANRPQGSSAQQSPLLPNSMLWKWRNVVSQYFQR